MPIEPARRVTAVALKIRPDDSAAARFAGFDHFPLTRPGAYAPGRGPQPSISAGVEVFMLSSAPRTSQSVGRPKIDRARNTPQIFIDFRFAVRLHARNSRAPARGGQTIPLLPPEPGRIEARAPRPPHRRRWNPCAPTRVPRPCQRLPVSKNRLCAPWSPGTARR